MNKEITKPLTVARQDLLTDIVSAINSSGLPAFIVSGLLSDLQVSVSKLAQDQLQTDMQQYQERLARQRDKLPYKGKKEGGDINGRC